MGHQPLTINHPAGGADAMSIDNDAEVERQIHRMSRRSLLWGAVAIGAGLAGREWLITRREDNGVPWPFRRALEVNEQLARAVRQGGRDGGARPLVEGARAGDAGERFQDAVVVPGAERQRHLVAEAFVAVAGQFDEPRLDRRGGG